jgi:hypothetical protein
MKIGTRHATYDKNRDDNIPRCVNHVHLPPNINQADWHNKYEDKPANVSQGTKAGGKSMYAKAFSVKDETASPLARIE